MYNASVQLPDEVKEAVDRIAEEHDTTRAAVLRSAIDSGLRARKYYPEEFSLEPERHEMRNAPDLAKDGDLPR